MFNLLIIIPEAGFRFFLDSERERMESFQVGTQTGRMKDGRSFKVVTASADFLEKVRGLRFGEYMLFGKPRIHPAEMAALQAMVQRQ